MFTKKFLLNWLVVTSALVLSSCAKMSTSVMVIDADYQTVDQACDEMEASLNFEKVKSADSLETFGRLYGKKAFYLYRKTLEPLDTDSTKVTLNTLSMDQRISDNLNTSFQSFLVQDINPAIVENNPGGYFSLPAKSFQELDKRININSGYGILYTFSENPYIDNSKPEVVGAIMFGMLDILYTSMIVWGPIVTDKPKDRIMFPIVGVMGALGFKYITRRICRQNVIDYNNIIESGYMLPVEIKD